MPRVTVSQETIEERIKKISSEQAFLEFITNSIDA
jgi:hypothetical protein